MSAVHCWRQNGAVCIRLAHCGCTADGITAGDAPDFALTLCPTGDALHLVPSIGVLGVGCKRGTSTETLAEAFAAFCAQNRLAPQCITAAASID